MKILIILLILSFKLIGIDNIEGIVKSKRYESSYWFIERGHGSEGALYFYLSDDAYGKIRLKGTLQKNWRDITEDDEGNLFILESANNDQNIGMRLYKIKKPKTYRKIINNDDIEVVNIRYSSGRILDLEGIFYNDGFIYFLTRQFAITRLYRVTGEKVKDGITLNLQFVKEISLNIDNTRRLAENILLDVDIFKNGSLVIRTLDGLWYYEDFFNSDKRKFYKIKGEFGDRVAFFSAGKISLFSKVGMVKEVFISEFVREKDAKGIEDNFFWSLLAETKEKIRYLFNK